VSDEIMINGGNKIIKTHLIKTESMAVQVGVSPVALELGYLNSFQERASGVDYFRDIIRFSFIHKMKI
jgi:hypothetical protein